jgi:hypothetical protein
MRDLMTNLDTDNLTIRATLIPRADGNLVLVDASTADGRRVAVVWERDGTGYPVVDDMEDDESDLVWAAAEKHMLANGFWA